MLETRTVTTTVATVTTTELPIWRQKLGLDRIPP